MKPGFDADEVIAFEMVLPEQRYPAAHQRTAFTERLIQATSGIAGVESAAVATSLPTGGWPDSTIEVSGRAMTEEDSGMEIPFQLVSPSYFETIGVPLQRGRAVTPQDGPQSLRVAVINARLARLLWKEAILSARSSGFRRPSTKTRGGLSSGSSGTLGTGGRAPAGAAVYPFSQVGGRSPTLLVRAADPGRVEEPIRARIRRLDPELPIAEVQILRAALLDSLWLMRLTVSLFGISPPSPWCWRWGQGFASPAPPPWTPSPKPGRQGRCVGKKRARQREAT